MNCRSAQDLLSAFYDRELSSDLQSQVRAHVESCPECTQKLAEFAQLSRMTTDLRNPKAPFGTWSKIESALDYGDRWKSEGFAPYSRRHRSRLAIAAALLVGATTVLSLFWIWRSYDPHEVMAANFDLYLKEFDKSPEHAQQVLISRYEGYPLEHSRAAQAVEFQPRAPEELPDDFRRQEIYVLKMPCCTCTQTVYKDNAGSVLVLLEHSEKQPKWFGNRPQIAAECHGKATHLVQLPQHLAATWKCGPRYLTVIGAQNVEQIAELVAFLDGQS